MSVVIQSDFGKGFGGAELRGQIHPSWNLGANWQPQPRSIRTVTRIVNEKSDISMFSREVKEAVRLLIEERNNANRMAEMIIAEKLPKSMQASGKMAEIIFKIKSYHARLDAGHVFAKVLATSESELTGISKLPRKTSRILVLFSAIGLGLGCFTVFAMSVATRRGLMSKPVKIAGGQPIA